MKISRIVDAVGYIDDDLITASIDYKPRKIKMKWIPYAAAAACAACFCILAVRISGNVPGHDTANMAFSGDSGENSSVTSPVNMQPISDDSFTNPDLVDASYKDPDKSSGVEPEGSRPKDPDSTSLEKPGSSKPENPVTSSGEEPNAYLSTKPVTFSTAKEQVKFTEVKEVSGENFVGYELDYVMPSETLWALNYVYTDGEVTVRDNSGDCGVIRISPEYDEKIERDGMVFWKYPFSEQLTVVYISESDVAYIATFKSDADLSKAIDRIKSLV